MNTPNHPIDSPESAGMASARLERIDRLFQGYLQRADLAGMIATLSRDGQTVYLHKCGWRSIEEQLPMQDDTIFMIASMTKPVTSVAAMMLFEEGHFHLNTPVSDFIPGFKDAQVFDILDPDSGEMRLVPAQRQVTMRHLFTHTAGLSYGWDPLDPIDRAYQQARISYETGLFALTNQALATELSHLPLAFQPGSHWRYSLSIDLIGAIVEIISGQPLSQFLQERIFDPLKMVDTGFFVPPEKLERLASVYGHPDPEKGLVLIPEIKPATEPPTFESGGGGLVSTLGDYARFCQMLVNGGRLDGYRLLGPKTVELYRINHCPQEALPYSFDEGSLYHAGYGYSLGTRVLMDVSQSGMYGSPGEFGWDGAFSTYFWVDLHERLYGILMLQHSPNAYYPIHQQFKQLAYQAILS
jgi:CubicO group peptidase (beta-lactamase class C family)